MNETEEKKDLPDGKVDSKHGSKRGRGHRGRKGGKRFPAPTKNGVNSPAFWNKVPGLLGAAGRIPSTTPFVTKAPGYGSKFYDPVNGSSEQNQLCVIDWFPSIGPATGSVQDPINTAAQQLFTYIRQNVSGSRNYEAADLIQYITAVYSCIAYYYYLRLIYGCTDIVSALNRDLARAICESLGYDYDDIVGHKADLLFYINNFAYKLTQFPVPAGWSCLEHWKLLLSGIFTDRYVQSAKNQFYLFAPRHLYRYDWANASLELMDLPNLADQDQFTTIITNGNNLLQSLMNNSDVQQMSADILRVFTNNLEKIETTDIAHRITMNITTNEMLNQIRNLEFFGMIDATDFVITQSGSSCLEYANPNNHHPKMLLSKFATSYPLTNAQSVIDARYGKGKVLIAYEPDLDPDKIIVATRMMVHYEVSTDANPAKEVYANLISWGVEIFTGIHFVKYAESSFVYRPWTMQMTGTYSVDSAMLIESGRAEFEGAPRMYYLDMSYSAGSINLNFSLDFFSLDNFILISNELLDDLHYTAVQSAFYVPLASAKTV